MRGSFDQKTGIADVLSTEIKNGEVRCQIGDLERDKGTGNGISYWGPWGFISRPLAPLAASVALAWYVQDGNRKRILGFKDSRLDSMVGTMEPGDIAMASPESEARVMVRHTRQAAILYSVNPQGKSMYVTVDGESGKIMLLNGGAWVDITPTKITAGVNNGPTVTLDGPSNSVKITAKNIWLAGSCMFGQLGPNVPPAIGVNSAVVGPTGIAGVGSTQVAIAP